MIKRKSLLVITVSSIVISLALIFSLTGYLIYLEITVRGSRAESRRIDGILQARRYSSNISISKVSVKIEPSGALLNKPILEGRIENNGMRNVSSLILKTQFKDSQGANIYEVIFDAMSPALGSAKAASAAFSYFSGVRSIRLPKHSDRTFKHVLLRCPRGIKDALKQESRNDGARQWPGRVTYEILSLEFSP
ncbi:MAG: hypothetical protein ABIJ27_03615 [Candidatus Omnitrophota bacterium]